MANNQNDRNQQNMGTGQQGMGKDSTQRQEGQGKSGSDRNMSGQSGQSRDQQSSSGQQGRSNDQNRGGSSGNR